MTRRLADRQLDVAGEPAADDRVLLLEEAFFLVIALVERIAAGLQIWVDFRITGRRDAQVATRRWVGDGGRREDRQDECGTEDEDEPSPVHEALDGTSHGIHSSQTGCA